MVFWVRAAVRTGAGPWQTSPAPRWHQAPGSCTGPAATPLAASPLRPENDFLAIVSVALQFEQENQRLIGEMNSLFDEVRYVCTSATTPDPAFLHFPWASWCFLPDTPPAPPGFPQPPCPRLFWEEGNIAASPGLAPRLLPIASRLCPWHCLC